MLILVSLNLLTEKSVKASLIAALVLTETEVNFNDTSSSTNHSHNVNSNYSSKAMDLLTTALTAI